PMAACSFLLRVLISELARSRWSFWTFMAAALSSTSCSRTLILSSTAVAPFSFGASGAFISSFFFVISDPLWGKRYLDRHRSHHVSVRVIQRSPGADGDGIEGLLLTGVPPAPQQAHPPEGVDAGLGLVLEGVRLGNKDDAVANAADRGHPVTPG